MNEEDEKERRDRQLIELLNELRVALPGVQVLFAFLLIVPFSQGFPDVTPLQRHAYFATLLCTAVSAILLIAPSSPPPPVAPARQRGDAQDVQPPHHCRIGLPRLGDDRRGVHDHRLPVRGHFVGGGRRRHRGGFRVVLVRAAAASSARLARGGANVHDVDDGIAYSEVALPLPATFRELPGLVGVSRA
jgi:Family of unknown function (DUF6328)